MATHRRPISAREVREAALTLHDELRGQVRKVLAEARVSAEWPPAPPLLEALQGLEQSVRRLVRRERDRLRPVLRNVDAWGAARVARLGETHRALYAAVDRLDKGERDARGAVRSAVMGIVRALRREERESLDSKVLSDDTITHDQADG